MRKMLMVIGLAGVILASGCTEFGMEDETFLLDGNPYDAFTNQITSAQCNAIFEQEHPGEEKYWCYVSAVDVQDKTFDCTCTATRELI